jgi:mRNA-degrading endonuclease RelE of RelBE toxin-antitoxin system
VQIIYSREAQKALARSNKRALILDKLEQLAANPGAMKNNITQLRGREEMRLRVQDWRIIFLMMDDAIKVREIAPRSSVYED